ncbi:unnamed protein product [Candida verbasci]|uniref:Dolichyl-phosphate-mannose--protein mannosyltransferase n=1 Tax=Candida verbasci TaxID=1227364 RepID=A0A9W4TSU0_9ASCO|nr:unnamed protein product [Candida verbasci]
MIKKGPFRQYNVHLPIELNKLTKSDLPFINLLLLISLVKFYQLYKPDKIVFDEIHFVSYINNYFKGEFFVDVHPPLGKLIYYYIAKLAGYNGEMDGFGVIGDSFGTFPYLLLRSFSSIISVVTVLISYLIFRFYTCPLKSFLFCLFVIFENSIFTNSRFIMLDSMLLFGQALIIYTYKKIDSKQVFSSGWYKWLLFLGLSIGYTISIKLSGLFTWIWVGSLLLFNFWNSILTDLTISTYQCFKYAIVVFFNIILIPLSIYCLIFHLHFNILTNQGNSILLSSQFKSTFQDYTPQPLDVLYGSTITLKHLNTERYLHSHKLTYPGGSNLQQVTLYEFEDDQNEWIVENKSKFNEFKLMNRTQQVKDGDIVRLYHKSTGKYLHVNKDIRPPISEKEYNHEVNCNSTRGLLGDEEYEFRLRIVGKSKSSKNQLPLIKLRTSETIFQLVHRHSKKCVLYGHDTRLPQWGENQNEVLCVEEPTIPNSLWYIETNEHPLLQGTDKIVEFNKMTIFEKLYHLHKTMFKLNSSFTLKNPNSSSPTTWPLSIKGLLMFNEVDLEDQTQIYYMGNLPIYTFGITLVILSIIKNLYIFFRYNFNSYTENKDIHYDYLLGFLINYIPYFYMNRNLYLHHYLPSVYFIILLISNYFNSKNLFKNVIFGMLLISSVYWFYTYSFLIFGWNGITFDTCKSLKLFKSWSFNCSTYL